MPLNAMDAKNFILVKQAINYAPEGQHAQQIRDPSTRQIPLSEHIDNCSRSIPKFQKFPFFKMHTESISARLAKEKHFIQCFKPKLNVL